MRNLSDLDPVTLILNGTPTPSDPTPSDADALYLEELQRRLTLTRFVVQKILVPIVVLFGVTGNVLNIAVLTQKYVTSGLLALTSGSFLRHFRFCCRQFRFNVTSLPVLVTLIALLICSSVWSTGHVRFTFHVKIGVLSPVTRFHIGVTRGRLLS